MCTSVDTTGHTFVDDETRSAYVAYSGEVRVWQVCTGCGNVQTRVSRDVVEVEFSAPIMSEGVTNRMRITLRNSRARGFNDAASTVRIIATKLGFANNEDVTIHSIKEIK